MRITLKQRIKEFNKIKFKNNNSKRIITHCVPKFHNRPATREFQENDKMPIGESSVAAGWSFSDKPKPMEWRIGGRLVFGQGGAVAVDNYVADKIKNPWIEIKKIE